MKEGITTQTKMFSSLNHQLDKNRKPMLRDLTAMYLIRNREATSQIIHTSLLTIRCTMIQVSLIFQIKGTTLLILLASNTTSRQLLSIRNKHMIRDILLNINNIRPHILNHMLTKVVLITTLNTGNRPILFSLQQTNHQILILPTKCLILEPLQQIDSHNLSRACSTTRLLALLFLHLRITPIAIPRHLQYQDHN